MNHQMTEAHKIADEELSDIYWWQIPLMAAMVGLVMYIVLGVLRFAVAGFLAAFNPGADTYGLTFWNNEVADGFVAATHHIHAQLAYGAVFVIVALLTVVKLLGGKFRA